MLKSVLISNRGEIAVRIARTLREMNIKSIGIYSSNDIHCGHVNVVDQAIELKGDLSIDPYLQGDLIIEIAKLNQVDGIIPGYGFLSENAQFAEKCQSEGIHFIGPTSEQIRQFGLKHLSYLLAKEANLPLLPHSDLLESIEEAIEEGNRVGYPLMLKSTAGSGGNGIIRCSNKDQLIEGFEKVRRAGLKFLKNDGIYLEKCIDNGRHIEVQIFGDGNGHVIAFDERDCSLQRRHQKIVEESPAFNITEQTRKDLHDAAIRLASLVKYKSVGTVEFIYDRTTSLFYFLEVNCRLQVEHGITECLYNIDLVKWMINLANGIPPKEMSQLLKSKGCSIEVRLCSEDPLHDFVPSSGRLGEVKFPLKNVRIDSWISSGIEVTPFYDSLLAKIIVHGETRQDAIEKMSEALKETSLIGINTNLEFLRQIINSKNFNDGNISLKFLTNEFKYQSNMIEVIEGGTYTTIQDYPGRIGYWDIGVPPSGPMDDYAFRLGNRLVGNCENASGLECTLIGITLDFHLSSIIAITGANMNPTIDGKSISLWKSIVIEKGQRLKLSQTRNGCRSYICIRGGLNVPLYLGSRSTFVLGQFGGYAGRILNKGDLLTIDNSINDQIQSIKSNNIIPKYPQREKDEKWFIGVLYGPHGSPDFFENDSIKEFFSTNWKVHHNLNRLGVRLLGIKPRWSRRDGGEAGLHPSNIPDCEYAIGSINFTGDTPIILTCDGPSLGGFVCPITIPKAELWKIGQVKANDQIQFYLMNFNNAIQLRQNQEKVLQTLNGSIDFLFPLLKTTDEKDVECILSRLEETADHPLIVYRQSGDQYILIEYGSINLNLRLRFRIHLLIEELRNKHPIKGILELSPGVRSLQVKYDNLIINQNQLLAGLITAEESLNKEEKKNIRVQSRIVHLPLAFEDSSTLDAVQRYRETVKNNAPWLPNNVDFIQRINGLQSRDDVRKIIFDSSYLIVGLGDVYLGAPCAIPIDPRHRLMTSKYNPARTYTAEGTVGIGGMYMCIYGMDSPGGYQLIGRTLPIWNTFNTNEKAFKDGKPWLLRFFDQIRFYPVTENELNIQRQQFRQGNFNLQINEENYFDFDQYEQFLRDQSSSIEQFLSEQNQAFTKEISHWQMDTQQEDQLSHLDQNTIQSFQEDYDHKDTPVYGDICGSIWKILVKENQIVEEKTPLIIIEAMKMEIIISSPISGKISSIRSHIGQVISNKDILLTIQSL